LKKLFYVLVLVMLALFVVSCEETRVDVSGLSLTGLSGNGTVESPFELLITKNETISTSIVLEPANVSVNLDFSLVKLVAGEFVPLETGDVVGLEVLTSSNRSKIDLKALEEGTHYVKISVRNQELFVYLKVQVASDQVPVTSISFPLLDGSGTLENPYEAEVSYTQTVELSFTVLPQQAINRQVNWEVGQLVEDQFVPFEEGEEVIGIAAASVTRVTIEGVGEEGTGYLRGLAADGSGVTTYVKVDVLSFQPVESIETTVLLEGNDTDFMFKTAQGTQWDMSDVELARKQGLIDGTAGPGGGQAAEDMTYWPSLYNFNFTVLPETASNNMLMFEYSVPNIIQINADGTWEALNPGVTIVTVKSFTNPDVYITIEVEVEASLYPGILQSAFDDQPVSERSDWDFDDRPDDLRTRPIILEWQLVQMQTNSFRGEVSDDGNQKMFYLGQPDRIYGIALESRVNNNRGDINKTTALTWNKVAIGEEATTMEIVIGNNDKVHNQYRIVMVREDGVSFTLQDWTPLTVPNGSSRVTGIVIPEEVKGHTVALVIEQRLTEIENNAEIHIKGIWVNQYTPVTDVEFLETEGQYGQGASFMLNVTVLPGNATDKRLTFVVIPQDQGVSVAPNGLVTIAADAVTGEYEIRAVSLDNPQLSAVFNLTVDDNVPVTFFDVTNFYEGSTLEATFGSFEGAGGRMIDMTDQPLQLEFVFNEGASDQTVTVLVSGDSVLLTETGILTFVGVGSSVVTITPNDNPRDRDETLADLSRSFVVNVIPYGEENLIVPGVQINQTEANNKIASHNTSWTTRDDVLRDWQARNINRDHGGSKVVDFTDGSGRIVFEGHATTPNFTEPINMVWTKVHVDSNINAFTFNVRSHDDDRILESSNFRVRVVILGETPVVNELIGWTTVAGRWRQYEEWFAVTLDVSAYQNQEIIIMIEQTGSLQNNGNWPKFSDSGAGAYLHFRDMQLLETEAPSMDDIYQYRTAFNPNIPLAGSGWTLENNPYAPGANVYEDGEVLPFALVYSGDLFLSTPLPTSSLFLANSSSAPTPFFYIWGLYPALNTNHVNNDVSYELVDSDNGVFTLENNMLSVVGRGETQLVVIYNKLGITEEKVRNYVTIRSEDLAYVDVESIDLEETEGTYARGQQFELNYIVNPINATDPRVTFDVTPNVGVTVTQEGLVEIAHDAEVGEYTITVASLDNPNITNTFILTVTEKPEYYDVSEGKIYKFETVLDFDDFTSSNLDMSESNYAVLNKSIDSNWNICLDGGDCDGIQAAIVLSGSDESMEDMVPNAWVSIKVLLGEYQRLSFVAGTDSAAVHFAVMVIEEDGTETILTNQDAGIYQILPGGYNQGNLIGDYDLSPWGNQIVTIKFLYDHYETGASRMFLDTIGFTNYIPEYINVSQGKVYKFETVEAFDDLTSSNLDMSESNYAVLNKSIDSNWNICFDGGDCDGIQAAIVLSGADDSMEDIEPNAWVSIKVLLGDDMRLSFVAGTDSAAVHFAVMVIEEDGTETILTNQDAGIYQILPGGYNQGNLIGDYDLSAWSNQVVMIKFLYDHYETNGSRMFLDTIGFNKPSE
jgi:hypothetical protein